MRKLLAILLLLLAIRAEAVLVTATVTVTNVPATSNSWTVNGDFRYWTNAQSATTILTNSTGLAPSLTNLLAQIQSKPYASIIAAWYSPTQLTLKGSAVLLSGGVYINWASVSYATNGGAITYTLDVPATNVTGLPVRTNNANYIVDYLNLYGVTPINTNAPALSNYVSIGTVPQTMANKLINGGVFDGNRATNQIGINGTVNRLTSGQYITPILISPVATNATNYGLAISSPGSAPGSEQFGTGATASGTNSFAGGKSANASKTSATAIGNSAGASGDYGTALGYGSIASGWQSIGIGALVNSAGSNSIAIGAAADAGTYADVVVLGTTAFSTDTNQVTLGNSTYTVRVPGRIVANSITNSTHTGTNQWHGSIQFPRAATGAIRTGLANTNNYLDGVTNAFIYTTGASTLHNYIGVKGGQDGQYFVTRDGCGTDIEVSNMDGGAVAADRIWTGTGSKVTLTNRPAIFGLLYNSQSNWWEFIKLNN